jgi:lipopolysaccharide biosynthesis glycosyltransferase
MIICDEDLIEKCHYAFKEFKNIAIVPCEKSKSAPESSMKKLSIFSYDISKYSKILFIDSDVLVGRNLDYFFENICEEVLYAGTEYEDQRAHTTLQHSLQNYTEENLKFLRTNKIPVFNCGFFGFLNTPIFKHHFDNIIEMIKMYHGKYYYEQSFMNVYFNLKNLVNTQVMNDKYYMLRFYAKKLENTIITKSQCKNKVVHFAWDCSGANTKLFYMKKWWNLFVE